MAEHQNRIVGIDELPKARGITKRMRHWRRDFQWRRRFQAPSNLSTGRPDPNCPDFGIGAIAVSEKYVDWCLTMIESARGRGAYSGPIYVVTDHPGKFETLDNVYSIAVPYSRVRLISKSLKPMLFEWLPQRYAAYIDADVIINGSLVDWYARSVRRLAEVASPLLTYEVDNPVAQSFHGGLLFAERESALPFFRQWLKMLRSGRYLSDQAALRRIATATTPAYYSKGDFRYSYEHLEHGRDTDTTFVHVTNRMIQDHPPEDLRRYLRETLGVTRIPAHFG